ncbi:Vacuolar protein sorting-associated protein 8 [Nowakowskiella sp. JEL0407]|nr:Vacuolar protein sorting-associated protein 8 [Nowakowskiella sp. JEL0407]
MADQNRWSADLHQRFTSVPHPLAFSDDEDEDSSPHSNWATHSSLASDPHLRKRESMTSVASEYYTASESSNSPTNTITPSFYSARDEMSPLPSLTPEPEDVWEEDQKDLSIPQQLSEWKDASDDGKSVPEEEITTPIQKPVVHLSELVENMDDNHYSPWRDPLDAISIDKPAVIDIPGKQAEDGTLEMQDLDSLQLSSTPPQPQEKAPVFEKELEILNTLQIKFESLIIPDSALLESSQSALNSTIASLTEIRQSLMSILQNSDSPSIRLQTEDLIDSILKEITSYEQFVEDRVPDISLADILNEDDESVSAVQSPTQPLEDEIQSATSSQPSQLRQTSLAVSDTPQHIRRSSIAFSATSISTAIPLSLSSVMRPTPPLSAPQSLPSEISFNSSQNRLVMLDSISNGVNEYTGTSAIPPAGPNDGFKWITMRKMAEQISFVRDDVGEVTTFTVNSLGFFIGTTKSILWFDFGQNLKSVFSDQGSDPVMAVEVSKDGLLVAGHLSGTVSVWDVNRKFKVVSISPSLGDKDGHSGNAIVSVGFVGRDIVSADSQGVAFYHVISKLLLITTVNSTRIHGRASSNLPLRTINSPPTTIYSMETLPSTVGRHPAESLGLVALVTPYKVAIMNMKPTPQIQFKMAWSRSNEEDISTGASKSGAISWCPCLKRKSGNKMTLTDPILACSSGPKLYLIRVCAVRNPTQQQQRQPTSTQPSHKPTVGIEYRVSGSFTIPSSQPGTAPPNIVAIRWLSEKLVLLFTSDEMVVLVDYKSLNQVEVSDVRGREVLSWNPHGEVLEPLGILPERSYSGSVCVFKGRLFLLGRNEISVASQLSWTDRTQALVRSGDFSGAIRRALEYYDGSLISSAGLPDDEEQRHQIVAEHTIQLLLNYIAMATSGLEDTQQVINLSTNTTQIPLVEITGDEPQIDTTFYTELATTTFVTLHKLNHDELLFSEVYDRFASSTVFLPFYLAAFESYILAGLLTIPIPPAIVKSFIDTYYKLHLDHPDSNYLQRIEEVILTMDFKILDIDLLITLCNRHSLYRLLCAVYNRGINDFVTPIKILFKASVDNETPRYLLFMYLLYTLSGNTFPENEKNPDLIIAKSARIQIYEYLFAPYWVDEETDNTDSAKKIGQAPFPYIRELLRRDCNSFLNVLGSVFEDAILNGELKLDQVEIDRQLLLDALVTVVEGEEKGMVWVGKVYAFAARCAKKYSTFVRFGKDVEINLVSTLITSNISKLERETALMEFFSVVKLREDELATLIEKCKGEKLFQVLEYFYFESEQYHLILSTYMEDENLERKVKGLSRVVELLKNATLNQAFQIRESVMNEIIGLIALDSAKITSFVTQYFGKSYHQIVISTKLKGELTVQFKYLAGLLDRRDVTEIFDAELYQKYIELMCIYENYAVVKYLERLENLSPSFGPGEELVYSSEGVLEILKEHHVVDAAVWILMKQQKFSEALEIIISYEIKPGSDAMIELQTKRDERDITKDAEKEVFKVTKSLNVAMDICQQASDMEEEADTLDSLQFISAHAQSTDSSLVVARQRRKQERQENKERMWYALLESLVSPQRKVVELGKSNESADLWTGLLQTFQALTRMVIEAMIGHVSLPKIFDQAVNTNPSIEPSPSVKQYSKLIDTLLEHYRYESEQLLATNRVLGLDVYNLQHRAIALRQSAARPNRGICAICLRILHIRAIEQFDDSIVVFKCKHAYHRRCIGVVIGSDEVNCVLCAEDLRALTTGERRMKGGSRKRRAMEVLRYLQQVSQEVQLTPPTSPIRSDTPDSPVDIKGKGKQKALFPDSSVDFQGIDRDLDYEKYMEKIRDMLNTRIQDYERFQQLTESFNWTELLTLFEPERNTNDEPEDRIEMNSPAEINEIDDTGDVSLESLDPSANLLGIADIRSKIVSFEESRRLQLTDRVLNYCGRNAGVKLQLAPPPVVPVREAGGFFGVEVSGDKGKGKVSVQVEIPLY